MADRAAGADTELNLVKALRIMIRIREFENTCRRLFARGRLPGFVHLYIGQEAVATGTCLALRPDDQITSNHRGHGHVIAKGGDPARMFAELLGKADGYCGGKGGSMHIVDFPSGMLGTNGIVGGGIPIAAGAALANQYLANSKVALSFFGDGATNQGVFFESLNLAALWRLPIIFLVENNQYTEWTRTEDLTVGEITARAAPFGVPARKVDGNDVAVVYGAVREAAVRARSGEGPSLIECATYRWQGHNEGEEAFAGRYRPASEIEEWKAKDPIAALESRLLEDGVVDDARLQAIRSTERDLIEESHQSAAASPAAPVEDALADVFADGVGL